MSRKILSTLGVFFPLALAICACKSTVNPNQGFTMQTRVIPVPKGCALGPECPNPAPPIYIPSIPVSGDCQYDLVPAGYVANLCQTTNVPGVGGTVKSFNTFTAGKQAQVYISNGRANAYWNIFATWPYFCGPDDLYASIPTPLGNTLSEYEFQNTPIQNLSTERIDCYQYDTDLPGASSRFGIAGSLPPTITLNSLVPFITQYGNPQMYIYDASGNVISQVTASSVTSNGASATFPLPSNLAQNGYDIALVNQTGGGATQSAGYNLLSIAGSQTIAGNPFGVAVGAQTDNFLEANSCVSPAIKTTSSSYITFPVVSLYSSNQVKIDSRMIGVGANPTAVATYPAYPVTINCGSGCDLIKNTFAGTTRAIVTNSGANTVTILDIVHDAVVTTITVGNQPVAVATAADGSAGYVANYQSSTVSRIDLKTNTVTSTVAVGGNPTSVSLTSGGILWVGGAGFLTQVNTSTMGVVGTESVAGKTIIALGYSDSLSELISTSVDSSGNVMEEDVNPTTFHAGGTYTPVASHTISTLGTYTRQPSGQLVRAFTSTLANSTSISSILVGAPPLVVQDGWAVVTATPTGFTITDASGHVVLVSETTPSPITAIAVDAKLNVAYLTMPDSNTMLTVPLPGTN
jgi:YVTN family beta-propeller protein